MQLRSAKADQGPCIKSVFQCYRKWAGNYQLYCSVKKGVVDTLISWETCFVSKIIQLQTAKQRGFRARSWLPLLMSKALRMLPICSINFIHSLIWMNFPAHTENTWSTYSHQTKGSMCKVSRYIFTPQPRLAGDFLLNGASLAFGWMEEILFITECIILITLK